MQEVGLQFRTYLLWRRLTLAVNEIVSGTSLTEAAHEAGFSDSAHFSRTFLRMFGAGLLALTTETEQIVDGSTYQARQLGAIATPGALVEGWRLTL